MPSQSPAAGAVAAPSLSVSPTGLSSRIDVNVTGAADVPCATSSPSTVSRAPLVGLDDGSGREREGHSGRDR